MDVSGQMSSPSVKSSIGQKYYQNALTTYTISFLCGNLSLV